MTIIVWFDPNICGAYELFYDLDPSFLPRLSSPPQYSNPVRVHDNILCIEDCETEILFVPIDTPRRNVRGDIILIPNHFSGDFLEIAKASARSYLIGFYDQERILFANSPAWHNETTGGETDG